MLNNPTSLIDPLGLDAGDPMDCQYDANGVLRCGPTHRGKGSDGDGGTRVAQFGDVIASLIMGDGGFCTISMGLFSFTVYGCGRPSGGTPGRTTVVTKPGGPFPAPRNSGAAQLVASELKAYNACVQASPWHEFGGEKLRSPDFPTGMALQMGKLPDEGVPQVPSNTDMYTETMKSCLRKHPLAALGQGYQGLPPGFVF